MLRRSRDGLKTVAPEHNLKAVLKLFHDSVGYWDLRVPGQLISERFWWPSMQRDVTEYIFTCNSCQRMRPATKYVTTLCRPLTSLFDAFSVYIAGPFPTNRPNAPTFLLVCVEYSTN